MPFIPDIPEIQKIKPTPGFIPDEPIKKNTQEFFKTGITKTPNVSEEEPSLEWISPDKKISPNFVPQDEEPTLRQRFFGHMKESPPVKIYKVGRELVNLSKKGWQEEILPRVGLSDEPANIPQAIARGVAEIGTDFAAETISPEMLFLAGAGAGVRGLKKAEPIQKGLAKLENIIPEKVKRVLTYRFGQPKEYVEMAEQRGYDIAKRTGKAVEIAKPMSKLPESEQKRVGQLIKGGISTSEREKGLREIADKAKQEFFDLSKEAKDLGLLGEETYLTKLPKARINELFIQKKSLEKEINDLSKGNIPIQSKQKLLEKINNLKSKKINVSNIESYVESLEPSMKNISKIEKILNHPKVSKYGMGKVRNMLERLEISEVGEREKIVNTLNKYIDEIGSKEPLIIGLKPLIKEMEKFKYKIPRRRNIIIRELKEKVIETDEKIKNSYKYGGMGYLPRLYETKEKQKIISIFAKNKPPVRIDRQRFMKREDIPEDVRKAMGEIMEAGYPTAKGLNQLGQAVETAKMFRKVASNPNFASPIEKEGFVKMAENKKLGDLSGKWVHPEIQRDIDEIVKIPSDIQKSWDSIINAWKFGKVVLNPATHSRNMMSNTILLDLSGVDHLQQARLIPKAAKELTSKGNFYKEAVDANLLGKEFYGGEIKNIMDIWSATEGSPMMKAIRTSINKFGEKAGNIYQAEDQLFKLVKYISEREKGMSIEQAVKEAEKWVFNYEICPPIIKWARKSPVGSPFITFSSKALPRIGEVAMTHPERLYKYKLMFDAIENKAQKDLNLNDREKLLIKKSQRGASLILPMKDDKGRPYVLDLAYILPWGDIGELGGYFGLPPAISPSGGPLKSIFELGVDKSQYTGFPIFPKQVPAKDITGRIKNSIEDTKAAADYLYKAFMPSFAVEIPGITKGSYSYHKLKAAMEGRPDYYGMKRTPLNTIIDVFLGLKARPTDIGILAQKAGYRIEDLERELKKQLVLVLRDKSMTLKEKKEAVNIYQGKMKDLAEYLKEKKVFPK